MARCVFVATKLAERPVLIPQKHLAGSPGLSFFATQNFKHTPYMERKKKIKYCKLRLSEEEARIFQEKARHYDSVSAMVRNAVINFDDQATLGKYDAIMEMITLYKRYQRDLALVGNNLNQVVKNANQLAIGNKLNVPFFENILFPHVNETQKNISLIKRQLTNISKKLVK